MSNRRGQNNMSHPFAANRRMRYFNITLVANHIFITDFFILAAITFVIFCRTKNPFGKEAVFFRPLSAVINGFRFYNFTMRPFQYFFRRGDFYFLSVEINHINFFFTVIVSISRPKALISFIKTIKAGGMFGALIFSFLIIDSNEAARPITSSDLMVSISCKI